MPGFIELVPKFMLLSGFLVSHGLSMSQLGIPYNMEVMRGMNLDVNPPSQMSDVRLPVLCRFGLRSFPENHKREENSLHPLKAAIA